MSTLGSRVATGAVWMVALRLADRGIGFVSTLILARLLVPEDFGLVAMAMAVFALIEMGGQFGFDLALIRDREATREQYDSAWTLQAGYGLFMTFALTALAWPAARFFGDDRLLAVLPTLGLVAAIQGLENIGVVEFRKQLAFARDFQLMFTKKVVAFAVTVTLAVLLQSYWALLAGTAASRVTGVLLSYSMHPYRPRWQTSRVRELLTFSRWIVMRGFLDYAIERGSDFIVGRTLDASALGTYRVSREVATLPTSELIHPIMRAVFPGYATVVHDREQLARAYLTVQAIVIMLTLPAGVGIVMLSADIVAVLLGPKWVGAVPLIQILGLYGAVSVFQATNMSIFNVLGVPKWGVIVKALEAVSLFTLIGALLAWRPGVESIAWAAFCAQAVAIPLGMAMIARLLPIRLAQRLAVSWRPVLACAAMALVLSWASSVGPSGGGAFGSALQLALAIPLGGATFVVAVVLLWLGAGRPAGAESHFLAWVAARRR